MARPAGTHELGLFAATAKRGQPRDQRGRFVQVRYSADRLKVLAVARDMRARLGLPPQPLAGTVRPRTGGPTVIVLIEPRKSPFKENRGARRGGRNWAAGLPGLTRPATTRRKRPAAGVKRGQVNG